MPDELAAVAVPLVGVVLLMAGVLLAVVQALRIAQMWRRGSADEGRWPHALWRLALALLGVVLALAGIALVIGPRAASNSAPPPSRVTHASG
ncbi:MAG: hypothetical protein ACRDRN_11865 [Sciscionella sp.]